MARELRSNFQIPENFEFPEVLPRTRQKQRTMADPVIAAAAAAAVPETWHVNPYHGKFNPSTKAGQAIFEKKTKGLPVDERFNETKKYSQVICRLLQAKSSSLVAVVNRVLQEYDATVNVTSHGNLLTEYSSIEMNCLQREAHKRYSNAIAEGDVLPPTSFKVTQLLLDTRNSPGIKYSTDPKCEPINGSRQYSDKPKCERARPFLYFPCAHNLDIPSPAQSPRGN